MTNIDEKEILEIEKLKLETSKLLKESNWNLILKFYSAILATVTVTIFATKYFIGA